MNKYLPHQVNRCQLGLFLFGIIIIILGSFIRIQIFIFGLYMLFLCKEIKFDKFIYSISAIFAVILLSGVKTGIISLTFFPQAEVLLQTNKELLYWFREGHVHAIRLLIAYPGHLLSEMYDISLNMGFSYYGILIFLILYTVLISITLAKGRIKHHALLGLMVVIGFLAFAMNGRIAFAFLGYTFLIKAAFMQSAGIRFLSFNIVKLYVLGVLLTTVSSGCMILGISYLCCCCILKYLYGIKKYFKIRVAICSIPVLIACMPLLKIIGNYVFKMINKNIVFYGGGLTGLFGLLEHGLGKIFPNINFDLYIIFLGIGTMVLLLNLLLFIYVFVKKKNNYTVLVLGINLSCYGMLVGISTGSMGLIPVIIFVMLKFGIYKTGYEI